MAAPPLRGFRGLAKLLIQSATELLSVLLFKIPNLLLEALY
jgi:hypothetical protein